MKLSRRSLLKGVAAVGLIPTVALAAQKPNHPFGPDCIVIRLSHLIQAYENVPVPDRDGHMHKVMFLRDKLYLIRKNNPDKRLVLIDDVTPRPDVFGFPQSSYPYPDIVAIPLDGAPWKYKVIKDRLRIAPYII